MYKSIEEKFYDIILDKCHGDVELAYLKSNPLNVAHFDKDEFNNLSDDDKLEYTNWFLTVVKEKSLENIDPRRIFKRYIENLNGRLGWYKDEMELYFD